MKNVENIVVGSRILDNSQIVPLRNYYYPRVIKRTNNNRVVLCQNYVAACGSLAATNRWKARSAILYWTRCAQSSITTLPFYLSPFVSGRSQLHRFKMKWCSIRLYATESATETLSSHNVINSIKCKSIRLFFSPIIFFYLRAHVRCPMAMNTKCIQYSF